MLEVSASDRNGEELFTEEREYKNIGLSRRGEPATAAWLISSHSREKSTALRAGEAKTETFTVPVADRGIQSVRVRARIVSHHGLPVKFGKPAAGKVVLEELKTVELRRK